MHSELVLTREGLNILIDAETHVEQKQILVGRSEFSGRIQWLIHSENQSETNSLWPAVVIHCDNMSKVGDYRRKLLRDTSAKHSLRLLVGKGNANGILLGYESTPKGTREVTVVRILEPKLPIIHFTQEPRTYSSVDPISTQRWSRTITALGLEHWQRLRELDCVILGCGRAGSQVAATLAGMGVRLISLVDAHVLKQHHVGEMSGVCDGDVGDQKTAAFASFLRQSNKSRNPSDLVVKAVPSSVTSMNSLAALKNADFVFCCVDNATEKLAASFLAATYLKPLIAIDTQVGVSVPESSTGLPFHAEAHVRLTVPGESCLACLGRLPQFSSMDFRSRNRPNELLRDSNQPISTPTAHLASLTGLAANLSIRLFEDYMCNRVSGSQWLQIAYRGNDATPAISDQRTGTADCPVCKLTGTGDGGLQRFSRLVEQVSYWQFRTS